MIKKFGMSSLVLVSLTLTFIFWPSVLISSSVLIFQETAFTPPSPIQEPKTPLEIFIDNLEQALIRLGK